MRNDNKLCIHAFILNTYNQRTSDDCSNVKEGFVSQVPSYNFCDIVGLLIILLNKSMKSIRKFKSNN